MDQVRNGVAAMMKLQEKENIRLFFFCISNLYDYTLDEDTIGDCLGNGGSEITDLILCLEGG